MHQCLQICDTDSELLSRSYNSLVLNVATQQELLNRFDEPYQYLSDAQYMEHELYSCSTLIDHLIHSIHAIE